MAKFISTVRALSVLVILSCCANRNNITVDSAPDDYRTNHPISLHVTERSFYIPVSVSTQQLNQTQQNQIADIAKTFREVGKGSIIVRAPASMLSRNEADRQVELVQRALRSHGMPSISGMSFKAGETKQGIRVQFQVVSTVKLNCGRWPDDMLGTSSNRHYTNFGCAVRSNLMAQVANPNDFITPRTETSIDTERRSVVIDRYRTQMSDGRSEISY